MLLKSYYGVMTSKRFLNVEESRLSRKEIHAAFIDERKEQRRLVNLTRSIASELGRANDEKPLPTALQIKMDLAPDGVVGRAWEMVIARDRREKVAVVRETENAKALRRSFRGVAVVVDGNTPTYLLADRLNAGLSGGEGVPVTVEAVLKSPEVKQRMKCWLPNSD